MRHVGEAPCVLVPLAAGEGEVHGTFVLSPCSGGICTDEL